MALRTMRTRRRGGADASFNPPCGSMALRTPRRRAKTTRPSRFQSALRINGPSNKISVDQSGKIFRVSIRLADQWPFEPSPLAAASGCDRRAAVRAPRQCKGTDTERSRLLLSIPRCMPRGNGKLSHASASRDVTLSFAARSPMPQKIIVTGSCGRGPPIVSTPG